MANLPTGYIELEYIESTGIQYIDTNIFPTNNTVLKAQIQITTLNSNSFIFCSRVSYGNSAFGILALTNQEFRFDYVNQGIQKSGNIFNKQDLKFSSTECYVGDTYQTFNNQALNGIYSIYIFAGNTNNSVTAPINMKLYSCSILENDNLVRNFIPCKNESNEIGLYDLINSQFYGNNGTGSFFAGPEIPKYKPNIYTKINNEWKTITSIYAKENNFWQESI